MILDARAIGRRVVVRYTIGGAGPSGGPAMTDVVGHVLAVDQDTVTVKRRDGSTRDIPLDAVVVWKPVPDPPPR